MTTLQRALDQLAAEGFIQARGKLGTFVTERPPHLNRYGLVFCSHPGDAQTWGRLWTMLEAQATKWERSGASQFNRYYDLSRPDSEDRQTAIRDVEAHRLAGLIFTSNPSYLSDTPLMDEPGVPRVAIMTPSDATSIPCVAPDGEDFFVRAVDHLLQRGRKRIAILLKNGIDGHAQIDSAILKIFSTRDAIHRSYWRQYVDVFDTQGVYHTTHLLMHEGQAERPDGLIVSDDTMAEAAVAGLLAAGVRVPDELEVVMHCNFPSPSTGVFPIRRLGFDSQSLLKTCVDSIDQQRSGQPYTPFALIPAYFEEEISRQSVAERSATAGA